MCGRRRTFATTARSDNPIVLLQAMKEDPPLDAKCKDKFLVQSVAITGDYEYSNIASIVCRRIRAPAIPCLLTDFARCLVRESSQVGGPGTQDPGQLSSTVGRNEWNCACCKAVWRWSCCVANHVIPRSRKSLHRSRLLQPRTKLQLQALQRELMMPPSRSRNLPRRHPNESLRHQETRSR